MSTAQAAHRLGVRPQTLYAYVSRGVLHSRRTPDGRSSQFDPREVEALARRGRPRQASRSPSLDIEIHTSITEIDDHRIRFRGHDALQLATEVSFEMAAELVWSGALPTASPVWRGRVLDPDHITRLVLDRHRADGSAIVHSPGIRGHLRLIAAVAALDGDDSLDPSTVSSEGRALIATLVDTLPRIGSGAPRLTLPDGTVLRDTIAGRWWPRLTRRRATPSLLAALNASLVLLADHEMAASTLAARVAASTRAGTHGVVAAGMGALAGRLHGGESRRCRRLLARSEVEPLDQVIDDALSRFGRMPGFGQVLYPRGDPRARLLLTLLRDSGEHAALDAVDRMIVRCAHRGLPPPNVDLALAALGMVADMPDDAGEAIFTTARIVGWLAHAQEEHAERPLRFRPRAVYVGERP